MASNLSPQQFGTWYHGSPSPEPIQQFDHTKRAGDRAGPQDWNTHLGTHFTDRRRVAKDFAGPEGVIHHAEVKMSNPKHYEDEWDLAREAHVHANLPVEHEDDLEGPHPMLTLRVHPEGPKIAEQFKAHLVAQGHDSITYGNHYEGGTAAIPFDPSTQVNVTKTRARGRYKA